MVNISAKQFIQLLLIPILVFIIIYLLTKNNSSSTNINTIKLVQKSYKKLDTKSFYLFIQPYMKNYSIKTINEKFSGNKFSFEFISEYKNSIQFLHAITHVMSIEELLIRYEQENVRVMIKVSMESFMEEIKIKPIVEPINLFDKSKKSFDSIAIIDQHLFYKNKWLRVGDSIDNGVITNIELNGFYIKIDEKEKFVELFKDAK